MLSFSSAGRRRPTQGSERDRWKLMIAWTSASSACSLAWTRAPGLAFSTSPRRAELSFFLVPPPVSQSVVPLPCSWRLAVGLLGLRPLFWPVSWGSRFLESGHWRRRARVEPIPHSVVNGGVGGVGCLVSRGGGGGGRAAGAGGAVPQVREVLAGAAQLLRLRLRRMRRHSPRSLFLCPLSFYLASMFYIVLCFCCCHRRLMLFSICFCRISVHNLCLCLD